MVFVPDDVIRNIVEFLPYNERVEVNRCLPVDYRVVRKLDSDAHNLKVKVSLMSRKLARVGETGENTLKRIRTVKEAFLYLLHTKDTVLLTQKKFGNAIIQKTQEVLTGNMVPPWMELRYHRDIKSLRRVAEKLHSYMESGVFPEKNIKPKLAVVV